MQKSVENFFSCVREHPAMSQKRQPVANILIGSDRSQKDTAKAIIQHCPKDFACSLTYVELENEAPELVMKGIDASDLFIFMYDSSTRADINPHGPAFIPPLKQKMAEHWKKSVLLREYGEFFKEAFSESTDNIAARNEKIIHAAQSARRVVFHDGFGGSLCGTLAEDQAWKSLDGRNHYDLMPGEVATRILDLTGNVTFGGTFLSTVPFAIKYGVIEPVLHVEIEKSRVVTVSSLNRQLEDDFNLYLDRCKGNRIVEEFGIGTHLNVKLRGRNASFEERHAGLHLGLGGGERASHHLDLVFSTGTILFDDRTLFDGSFHL
ncbi:Uncharacterised protein [Serratia quinivorans]|uniref:leucyl aminopeptidase n=1 Tax=Serratia quinivorans TaxID=137545 RepID=UPI002177635B|nr:leucyl aminopeptidase [Serratia quinivorans]CAI1568334.1 Uncharacterised protein [Serratia quinivorans]CAI1695258.1 Uncharacterised protein [Serratia quinivorans]